MKTFEIRLMPSGELCHKANRVCFVNELIWKTFKHFFLSSVTCCRIIREESKRLEFAGRRQVLDGTKPSLGKIWALKTWRTDPLSWRFGIMTDSDIRTSLVESDLTLAQVKIKDHDRSFDSNFEFIQENILADRRAGWTRWGRRWPCGSRCWTDPTSGSRPAWASGPSWTPTPDKITSEDTTSHLDRPLWERHKLTGPTSVMWTFKFIQLPFYYSLLFVVMKSSCFLPWNHS